MSDKTQEKAIQVAREKLADADAFDAVVKFDMGDDGAIFVDGRSAPPAVDASAPVEPDCVISADAEVFQELMNGELDATTAYMTDKLAIDGDMGAAMKIAQALA